MIDWQIEEVEDSNNTDGWTVPLFRIFNKESPQDSFAFRPLFFGRGNPLLSHERWDYLNNVVHYRDSDIIVVSYPKCGTTWTEQILQLLINKGDVSKTNPESRNSYRVGQGGKQWPEAQLEQKPGLENKHAGMLEFLPISLEDFNTAPEPRTFKCHARYEMLLGSGGEGLKHLPKGLKVIIVSRNPLDACVSSFYHAWNPAKSGWPFDAWAAAWSSGYSSHGTWWSWVKGWRDQQRMYPDQVYWLQFEDLKKDPAARVSEIASFIGMPADAALIDACVAGSSFQSMKQSAGKLEKSWRKGVSGDWRNHFCAERAEQFKDRFRTECAGTGLTYSLGVDEETGESDELVAP